MKIISVGAPPAPPPPPVATLELSRGEVHDLRLALGNLNFGDSTLGWEGVMSLCRELADVLSRFDQ